MKSLEERSRASTHKRKKGLPQRRGLLFLRGDKEVIHIFINKKRPVVHNTHSLLGDTVWYDNEEYSEGGKLWKSVDCKN